jgi:hypothetical protein
MFSQNPKFLMFSPATLAGIVEMEVKYGVMRREVKVLGEINECYENATDSSFRCGNSKLNCCVSISIAGYIIVSIRFSSSIIV